MLRDVAGAHRDFDLILVYDVSRWGRFQDTDESAYYEFHCRKHRVRVEYCVEAFPNDGSALASIVKSIKRAMAAEFSRELSARVSLTMRQMTQIGHFHGGMPGYGLRRMMVDQNGANIGILESGSHKALRSGRTVLVPGPKEEVDTIREIFRLFVQEKMGMTAIARLLNDRGSEFRQGHRWESHHIERILRSERYIGTIVFYKTHSLLGTSQHRIGVEKSDPTLWVRSPPCFPPLVPRETFAAANAIPDMRGILYRDDEALLAPLRQLLKNHGYLTEKLICQANGLPSTPTYRRRFGSLHTAYKKIGYIQQHDYKLLPVNIRLKEAREEAIERIRAGLAAKSVPAQWRTKSNRLEIGNGILLSIASARFFPTRYFRLPRWVVRITHVDPGEAVIVLRMNEDNRDVKDYFLIPSRLWPKFQFRIYPDLRQWSLCRHTKIESIIEILSSVAGTAR